ncbi:MAG: hypothetical protein ACTSYJ_12210 [Candidatus Thorarchaeota archaeon]
MFEHEYEGNKGESLVRLVNFSRVIIYIAAALVQFNLLIDCINASGNCDWMIVLIPLFLGIWDFVMGLWSLKPSTRFWNIAFLVPVVSLIAAIRTIMSLVFMPSLSLHETIMLDLSIVVVLLSFIEFYGLREVTKSWNKKLSLNRPVDEIRTYYH